MRLIPALAAAILVADQITKWWALRDLRFGMSVPVVDGLFSLTLVMNPGLAFGMLGGIPESLRWMVGLLSLGAVVVLALLAARLLPTGGVWTRLALGLIFGGAVGNLIDRLRFGAVVDFLDFYWRSYHWPAFNVADSAITVGVTIIAIRMLIGPRPRPGTPREGMMSPLRMETPRRLADTVSPAEAGDRLDRWLAARLPDLSRTRVKALVDAGQVRVDGRAAKAALRLRAGARVEAEVPPPPPETLLPEPVALRVILEDDQVLVVDKPAGMVTHPGAGRMTGTLAAAALNHAPALLVSGARGGPASSTGWTRARPGSSSWPRLPAAYDSLTAQLVRRTVSRRYLAIAHGRLARDEGRIDAAVGRDPRSRVRMAVVTGGKGRRAITRYRVLERFADATLLRMPARDRAHPPDPGAPGLAGSRAPRRQHVRAPRAPARPSTPRAPPSSMS